MQVRRIGIRVFCGSDLCDDLTALDVHLFVHAGIVARKMSVIERVRRRFVELVDRVAACLAQKL
jgi:hypothetical protein